MNQVEKHSSNRDNVTPNGAVVPKRDYQLEYNLFIKAWCNCIKELSEKNAFQDILNIGFNSMNTTKQELILKMVTRNKLDFAVKYYSPDDSRSYKVDFSKMEKLVKEEPIQYVDGIDHLIQNFKERT